MLHGWCHVKCCRFGTSSVYTIQPCTRLQCHFIQSVLCTPFSHAPGYSVTSFKAFCLHHSAMHQVTVSLHSKRSVYTIQPCTRLQCHFIQSHIGRVYVCLAVTCHLHFWQNDWDLLCATAVTRGWKGYRNKSQHRKLTHIRCLYCCEVCVFLTRLGFYFYLVVKKQNKLPLKIKCLPRGLYLLQLNVDKNMVHTTILKIPAD